MRLIEAQGYMHTEMLRKILYIFDDEGGCELASEMRPRQKRALKVSHFLENQKFLIRWKF